MGRSLSYRNLTGGLNVENDIGTINQTTRKTESPDLCNVEYYGLGGIKTMEGNVQIGDSQTSSVVGGWDYIKGNNHYMLIATSDGYVKELNNGSKTFKTIYQFPSATTRCSFVNMNNGVVFSNGIDDLVFYEHGRNVLLSGTISGTGITNVITGTSTEFTKELAIGDYITIEDVAGKYKVTSITSDTQMEVQGTALYYGFFDENSIVYTLSATPNVGDNVYDDNFQVISTVESYLPQSGAPEGTGIIFFMLNNVMVERTREQTEEGVFGRDTYGAISPPSLTDKKYYLSDISECNARLTNENDPSIDEPIRGLALNYYQGRLFVGNTDGALFYSELGSYRNFDIEHGGGVIRNLFNDTSSITAIGLYSSYMIIHKKFSSYILDGKSSEPENWQLSPYSQITCQSQQSFTVFGRDYFVYDDATVGIYPLTTQTIYGDKYVGQQVSERINNLFKNLRSWDTEEIFICRLPQRRQIILYMPFKGESSSNIGIIYDFHTKTWLKRKVPQQVTIAFEFDNEVYIGTSDGKVLREFYSQTFDGEPIIAYWRSPWFDFGDSTHYKSFKEFIVSMVEEYNCNFKLRVRRDIQEDFQERHVNSEVYDEDALVWDDGTENNNNLTYWDENEWVKTGLSNKRFPVEKQFFFNYQVEFTTEDTPIEDGVQGFALYGFDIRNVQYEETPI